MSQVKLVCTDIDYTVLGDPDATARFRDFWHAIPSPKQPCLCYNSGRLVDDQLELIRTSPMPSPDFVIGGVGTAIYDLRNHTFIKEYAERLDHGWDLETVIQVMSATPGIELQPEQYQTKHKSSWFLRDASPEQIREIESRLVSEGLEVTIIYSSSRDLDVLPTRADKGDALSWLCDFLDIELTEVVVAGDTANDLRMFQVPGVRGIVVANAKPELLEGTEDLPVYRSRAPEADGVVEGLRHYGLGEPLA